MKIETITQTIEFTIEEKHSITVCRKRKIVCRASEPRYKQPTEILEKTVPINGIDISKLEKETNT